MKSDYAAEVQRLAHDGSGNLVRQMEQGKGQHEQLCCALLLCLIVVQHALDITVVQYAVHGCNAICCGVLLCKYDQHWRPPK